MQVTKVFKSGNSQAIRIPKDYQINAKEVYIDKQGEVIIIKPKKDEDLTQKYKGLFSNINIEKDEINKIIEDEELFYE
jgi:antitoxin VapB